MPPQPPEPATEPASEKAAAIGGALLLWASPAADGWAATALRGAIVVLLTGKERRQWLDQAGAGRFDGEREMRILEIGW